MKKVTNIIVDQVTASLSGVLKRMDKKQAGDKEAKNYAVIVRELLRGQKHLLETARFDHMVHLDSRNKTKKRRKSAA